MNTAVERNLLSHISGWVNLKIVMFLLENFFLTQFNNISIKFNLET